MDVLYYCIVGTVCGTAGFLLCAVLTIGREADRRARALHEAWRRRDEDQAALCDRCRELDEDRADAREWERDA